MKKFNRKFGQVFPSKCVCIDFSSIKLINLTYTIIIIAAIVPGSNIGLGEVTKLSTVDDGGGGFTLVNLVDVASSLLGNVLDGVVTLGDDADGLGNGFGCDGMITGDHDDLDTG